MPRRLRSSGPRRGNEEVPTAPSFSIYYVLLYITYISVTPEGPLWAYIAVQQDSPLGMLCILLRSPLGTTKGVSLYITAKRPEGEPLCFLPLAGREADEEKEQSGPKQRDSETARQRRLSDL